MLIVPRSTYISAALHPVQPSMHLAQDLNLSPDPPKDVPQLQNLLALHDYLTSYETLCLLSTFEKSNSVRNITKQRLPSY